MANFMLGIAELILFSLPNGGGLSPCPEGLMINSATEITATDASLNSDCIVGVEDESFNDGMIATGQNSSESSDGSSGTKGSWPGIKLTIKSGLNVSYTVVLYNDGMKVGLDPGYDVGLLSANPAFQLYSLFPDYTGVKYVQQALPLDGCDTIVVPLGFDCNAGGDISISAVTQPLDNYAFVLEDRAEGEFIDIQDNAYKVTLPPGVSGTGRFFLHAKLNVKAGVNDPQSDTDMSQLKIWGSENNVFINGSVSSQAIAEVYDIQGRLTLRQKLEEGTYNTMPLPGRHGGIYIVKVVDGKTVKTAKVLL